MDLEYRILGPLEVRRNGVLLDLGGAKQRTLLAALLLRANHTVSTDQLIDELWDTTPPRAARDTVHAYVRRLHRTLRGSQSGATGRLLHGDAYGYRLSIDQDQLDLHRFDRLVAQARQSLLDGRPAAAHRRLRDALELWRGSPLTDIASDSLRTTVAARLAENRLAAVEDRIDAELALGRHAGLIGELEELARTYPTRERFRGQLMLALYRTGRRVDALDVYRRTRHLLTKEYGCDPGPELKQLERAMLANDPVLDTQSGCDRGWSQSNQEPQCTPCQLPPDIGDFTGRAEVVSRLSEVLGCSSRQKPTAVPVVAIAGLAGIGKSTLAVHAAHQLVDRYPDGQLYANLRGGESGNSSSANVLAQFLRGLGVEDENIPHSLAERGQLFRTILAGRRVLVVLDDAAEESQVRPLLPGDAGCGAIITSRRRLAGLEAVYWEHLPVFTENEALELLRRVVGIRRVDEEHSVARTIASLCGYHPLALRISGARLAAKKHWPLHRLAGKLGVRGGRLDELKIGDLDLRASFESSYGELTEYERKTLCTLSASGTPDLPNWAAAAMLGVSCVEAEDLLERLTEVQLLDVVAEEKNSARYRFHGLVWEFVAERLALRDPRVDDGGGMVRAGLVRAHRTYLDLATRALASLRDGATVDPSRGYLRGTPHVDEMTVRQVEDDPVNWFIAETDCLMSTVEQAHEMNFPELAGRLAEKLCEFFRTQDCWVEIQRTRLIASRSVRVTGGCVGTRVSHDPGPGDDLASPWVSAVSHS